MRPGCGCWLALGHVVDFYMATFVIFLSNLCLAWTQVIADAVLVKLCQGRAQVGGGGGGAGAGDGV